MRLFYVFTLPFLICTSNVPLYTPIANCHLPFASFHLPACTYPSLAPPLALGPQPHCLQEYTGRYADSKARKATPVKTPSAGIFALLTAASSLVSPFCFSYVRSQRVNQHIMCLCVSFHVEIHALKLCMYFFY